MIWRRNYSVVSNLAKEHAAASRRRGVSVSVEKATTQDQLASLEHVDRFESFVSFVTVSVSVSPDS